ncbi:MAG: hypothetical protein JOZ41_13815 [Chloroflexi bacterium]|nr:hypothetical protein [Chloroflexota bacterium]
MTRQTLWALYRVALAACLAVGSLTALGRLPAGVNAAHASIWYWQNPLPQGENMSGVACPAVTACVAVGGNGSIATTTDGAQRWTHRTSGTTADLSNVVCPDRTICYAIGGFAQSGRTVFLASVDGGMTWKDVAHKVLNVILGVCLS